MGQKHVQVAVPVNIAGGDHAGRHNPRFIRGHDRGTREGKGTVARIEHQLVGIGALTAHRQKIGPAVTVKIRQDPGAAAALKKLFLDQFRHLEAGVPWISEKIG